MNIYSHFLTATGRFNAYVQDIKKISDETISKVTNILRVDTVDIVFVDNPKYTIPEIGIGGKTVNPNYIIISLNPSFSDFQRTLHVELMSTLAHELHHAARWQAVGYGVTLLEAMISEGLADHFAIEITSRKDVQLWDHALDNKQIEVFSKKAKAYYDDKSYNHSAWFFGSKKMKIPRWTGYTLGFEIIKNYLQNNLGETSASLYDADAKEFVT